MRRTKRDALLVKLVIAALVVLGVNTLLLVALLVRQGSAPAPAQPVASTQAAPTAGVVPGATTAKHSGALPTVATASPGAPAGGVSSLETVLSATVDPLRKAATDFGLDTVQLLPSDVELQACVAAGSLASELCQAVIAKLQAGYQAVNMPFPDLAANMGSVAPTTDAAAPTTPSQGEPAAAPTATPTVDAGQRDILRAFFSVTVERLAQQARKQGKEGEISLPADADIEAAAATGSIASEPCQALLDVLRAQYQIVGLELPVPVF